MYAYKEKYNDTRCEDLYLFCKSLSRRIILLISFPQIVQKTLFHKVPKNWQTISQFRSGQNEAHAGTV